MRFYAAGNAYLSSIQQGIQAFHCLGEMTQHNTTNTQFIDWLCNHKTLICVNGGNNQSLNEFYNVIVNSGYPVAKFHEDDASMAGMLTCVGIIVPERVYAADLYDPQTVNKLTENELSIATALKRMPLAR